MKILIAGGAGFIGSHLCAYYCRRKATVICLDNLSTGRRENLAGLLDHPNFSFRTADITEPLARPAGGLDLVINLASPASPADYLNLPLETLRAGSTGVQNMLELAREGAAAFVQASTSEIYGEPTVHPQTEDYHGSVNPVGPRSVYDESKRFGEAMTAAYHRRYGIPVGIGRIFNTYGPHLRPADGRVVSTFICQALTNRPVTIFGDGSQTRSLCYVSDLVAGLARLAEQTAAGPETGQPLLVNLGNPEEVSVLALAEKIISLCRSRSKIVYRPRPVDDPTRRCPDISRAITLLGWQPEVLLNAGLELTIAWFRKTTEVTDGQV